MTLGRYLSVASTGAGLAHGFCDAQNIPIGNGLENALAFGPAILGGIKLALPVGLVGIGVGAVTTDSVEGAVIGGTGSAIVAGGIGAVYRGIQTAVGYGLGYIVGAITR